MDAKPPIATGTRLVNMIGEALVIKAISPSTVSYGSIDGTRENTVAIWHFDHALKTGKLKVVEPNQLEEIVRAVIGD